MALRYVSATRIAISLFPSLSLSLSERLSFPRFIINTNYYERLLYYLYKVILNVRVQVIHGT